MHVLIISPTYLPAQGGAEIYLHEIGKGLASRGHGVTVAASDARHFERLWHPQAPKVMEEQSWIDGVHTLRFPIRHLPASPTSYHFVRRLLWIFSRLSSPIQIANRLSMLAPKMPALRRWLTESNGQFDLILAANIAYENFLLLGQQAAQRWRIPFFVCPLTHLGAGDQPGSDSLSQFYAMPHQRRIVAQSDGLIALTPAEADFYRQQPSQPGKILTLPPAIRQDRIMGGDGARFRKKHGISAPIVSSLGALSFDKGSRHLVEAMRQLWENNVEAELILAGQPVAEFERFLGTLPASIRTKIKTLGKISEEEKRRLLAATDIFALPSRVESFGIVFLEAWACGAPVIGANAWALRDVIDQGKDGLLLPFGDVPALARSIRRLLQDPQLRRQMGENGQKKVERYSQWEDRIDQIELFFRAAL